MSLITELHTELFSKQYYECIDKIASNDFETEKILGQFYTNIEVAKKMIKEVIDNFDFESQDSNIKIIDPFCGDGRLIVLFIELLSCKNIKDVSLDITIWDVHENNVIESELNILKAAKENSISIEIKKDIVDSYVVYGQYMNKFDICITNPPWGILKPQKILNGTLTKKEIEEYKSAISTYDNYMKQEFYLSQPTSKFGKWGTNFSRCGAEVAIRLVKRDGISGFVSPASLLSDQVSVPLRQWIFDNHCVYKVNYYPAEAKLYGTADTSSISVILKKCSKEKNPVIVDIHDKALNFSTHQLEEEEFNYIKKQGYNFPFAVGISNISILMKFEEMKSVEYYSNIWGLKFTREIDETRINEKLQDVGNIVFIKGYMVDRYSYDIKPKKYINTSIVRVPDSVNYNKIVWRDVARISSKRTIKATIVPGGFIAGNSLGVAYLENNNTDMLKALVVIMNSFIFELQARALLVTNHVSSGIIKKLKIPDLDESIKFLADMYDIFIANEISEQDLECIVAKLYGFTEDDFYQVLSVFKLESDEEKLLIEKAKKYLARESRLVNDCKSLCI